MLEFCWDLSMSEHLFSHGGDLVRSGFVKDDFAVLCGGCLVESTVGHIK